MNDNSGQVIVITPIRAAEFPPDIDPDDYPTGPDTELIGVQAEFLDLPTENTLAFLQEKVGGMIDVIGGADGTDYWFHDEGRLIDLPYNPVASDILGTEMFGPVVITAHTEDGDTIGLPSDLVRTARRYFVMQQTMAALAVAEMREQAERVVRIAEEMLRGE